MTAQPDLFGAPDVGGARHPLDAYDTPPWPTRALIHYLDGRLTGVVWEPCAGANKIVVELASHAPGITTLLASDVEPRAKRIERFDFIRGTENPFRYTAFPQVDWIVTNPPYRLVDGLSMTDFVVRALEYSRVGVAMLLRLSFLEPTEDRYQLHIEQPWTEMIVLPRVSFIGAPKGGESITHAWVIWDKSRAVGRGMYRRVATYPADIREPTFDRWGLL